MTASLRDALYGAAVGDALGVPFEFQDRDSFHASGMVGGGVHAQPAGTFSNDTSMTLALADSLARHGGVVDLVDIRDRFTAWAAHGDYAADHLVFDIGITTQRALQSGAGLDGVTDNGNGSLMRTIPLTFSSADDGQIGAVSAITHAHATSMRCCVAFVHIARALAAGVPLLAAITAVAETATGCDIDLPVVTGARDDVRSDGFVVDTLNAALWCLVHSDCYADAVLAAVNLGEEQTRRRRSQAVPPHPSTDSNRYPNNGSGSCAARRSSSGFFPLPQPAALQVDLIGGGHLRRGGGSLPRRVA